MFATWYCSVRPVSGFSELIRKIRICRYVSQIDFVVVEIVFDKMIFDCDMFYCFGQAGYV